MSITERKACHAIKKAEGAISGMMTVCHYMISTSICDEFDGISS